jgi:hypothetical protein
LETVIGKLVGSRKRSDVVAKNKQEIVPIMILYRPREKAVSDGKE